MLPSEESRRLQSLPKQTTQWFVHALHLLCPALLKSLVSIVRDVRDFQIQQRYSDPQHNGEHILKQLSASNGPINY